MLVYLVVFGAVVAWRFVPRPWTPTLSLETAHYQIASTATRAQTEDIGRVVEQLYTAYSNTFSRLPSYQSTHAKLKLRLFKDRNEFRYVYPNLGWAEAFYRKPYCCAYFSAAELNPYHWMLHEAVHQLNREVAQVRPAKWLEEGLATYFSASRLRTNGLAVGRIDANAYPAWWSEHLAKSGDLEADAKTGSVIPLRAIITNHGGPSMRSHFNLYYLHWWTLTHFLFEGPVYRNRAFRLLQNGGGLAAFEQDIGPVERVQREWYAHALKIKRALAGHDVKFFRTGEL